MKISPHDARSFFAHTNDAKAALLTIGDGGQVYINRLQAIRETFTPEDIRLGCIDAIEPVVLDLDSVTVTTKAPVERNVPIDLSDYSESHPGASLAGACVQDARSRLRDHAE